jgi:hypothetical protein
LGFRVKNAPAEKIELAIAVFDDDIPVTLYAQIYIGNKANWYELQTNLPLFLAGR